MSMDETLSLQDDLAIDTADPSEYATTSLARTSYAPIPDTGSRPGQEPFYTGRILTAEYDKDRTTGAIRTPATPVLLLSVEITEGAYKGRRLSFQRVYSKPYQRGGVNVSGLGDLLMAINAYDIPTEGKEKFAAVFAAVENGTLIKFTTLTRAFDKRWFENKGGQHMAKGTPEYKALSKDATLRGFRHFTATPEGKLFAKHLSGDEIEGRAEVNSWLPSTTEK